MQVMCNPRRNDNVVETDALQCDLSRGNIRNTGQFKKYRQLHYCYCEMYGSCSTKLLTSSFLEIAI